MARKPNPMLAKIEAKYERELAAYRRFTRQQCFDMMMVAANEAFGFGPERLKKLADAYHEVSMEYAGLVLDDAKIDKEVSYAKDRLDRKLEQIMGERFVPWAERYGG